ncbi:MAG: hypothetical protein IPQ17_10885 [Xanthomonadales bacterium]|nr:hypothetical protein [Xanthomonadales bacterium]
MNDFECRRLRARGSREPQHDLWPRIARQIAATTHAPGEPARRRRWPMAVAASMAMRAVAVGAFSLALQDRNEHFGEK